MKILICARGYNSFRDNTIGTFELDQAKALKAAGFSSVTSDHFEGKPWIAVVAVK